MASSGRETVLHIIYSYFPFYTGGRETVIKELILNSRWHPRISQRVVSFRRPNEPRRVTFGGTYIDRILRIPVMSVMSSFTFILNMLLLALKSLREACVNSVRIAHIHGPVTEAIAGLLLKKILKVKLIVHVHGYVEEEHSTYAPLLRSLWGYLYRVCLSEADVAIFVSPHIVQHTLEKKIHLKKPIVITSGVDLQKFQPRGPKYSKHKLLREAGIKETPQNPIIVAHIATLRGGFIKGHDLAVKAASLVTKTLPHTYFIFAGKGDQGKLRQSVDQLKVTDHVGILGERNDIPQILRSVDIVIHPSHLEGFSVAVLEALACGKPLIATPVGGTKDVIDNGVNGLLVRPSEIELAENIVKVIKNKVLRKTLSTNAILKAQQYDWKCVANKILEIYEKTLKNTEI